MIVQLAPAQAHATADILELALSYYPKGELTKAALDTIEALRFIEALDMADYPLQLVWLWIPDMADTVLSDPKSSKNMQRKATEARRLYTRIAPSS
tara:strand:- start:6 stop:293 length:288 start_codon:yes stop_codon:yes gene_type:complete